MKKKWMKDEANHVLIGIAIHLSVSYITINT